MRISRRALQNTRSRHRATPAATRLSGPLEILGDPTRQPPRGGARPIRAVINPEQPVAIRPGPRVAPAAHAQGRRRHEAAGAHRSINQRAEARPHRRRQSQCRWARLSHLISRAPPARRARRITRWQRAPRQRGRETGSWQVGTAAAVMIDQVGEGHPRRAGHPGARHCGEPPNAGARHRQGCHFPGNNGIFTLRRLLHFLSRDLPAGKYGGPRATARHERSVRMIMVHKDYPDAVTTSS